jgi:dimethylargininase
VRTGPLQRVLVRPPRPEDVPSWRELGWRAEPDPAGLVAEHEALCALLEDGGAEVVRAEGQPRSLDAIYTFDPLLMTDAGALLLRPGKPQRREEPEALLGDLVRAGVPVAGGLEEPALAEGGDTLWLDERTLVVGRSYRTNDAGVAALRAALPAVDVIAVDLPHLHGRDEVLHLLSLLSPLDDDLAVAYMPLLPVRLVELLAERGVELVGVPDDEFETMGPNVLALGPRVGLAIEGNDRTRRRLARAGVEVLVYTGEEISRKGDGGPTCLTQPLLRGAVDSGPSRSS